MALFLAVGLAPALARDGGLATRVAEGAKAAGLAAAGPKPFVDIVCPIMQEEAEARAHITGHGSLKRGRSRLCI